MAKSLKKRLLPLVMGAAMIVPSSIIVAAPAQAASGKWIEYNVSNYCLYLHEGDAVVWSTCATSNGKKGKATKTGHFKVYQKSAGPICMHPPGDDPVCGIHYATYWGKGGYAFHEAWWLGSSNMNQRISHGCVNMTKSDAKRVFDFASIGTPVWVHG